MAHPLKVLIVEDNPADGELVLRELRRAGFAPDWQRVDTEPDFLAQLNGAFDVVLSDYEMPQFSGPRALELLKESGREVPFIIVSGTIGEDTAVAVMKLGASDYLLKDRLARLGTAVTQAMEQSRLRRERREAAEALRLSEERFSGAFRVSPAAITLTRISDGKFVDINESFLRLFEFSRDEVIGHTSIELGMLTPEIRGPLIQQQRAAGGLHNAEFVARAKSGRVVDILFSSKPMMVAGEPCFITTMIDISERKRAEAALRESDARFRELAENIQEVFWVTDPAKNEMLYISPAYEKIWGRSCQSLYDSPRNWLEAIRAEDRERVVQAMGTKQGQGTYDEEYRITRPDGSERWIRDRAFPVRGSDGTLRRIVGVAEDITESKKLQEQFLRAQRMEAIGTLAGGIAHDLNNILAPIVMGSGLLGQRLTDARDLELMKMIEAAAGRGTNVIRQLLTFSRGIAGERVSLQLRHLLNEMADIIRETFPRDIELHETATRDLRVIVGDPTQLHQVIMNLCVNARDAMPHGGRLSLAARNVELSPADVEAHQPAKPGSYVAIIVADTGHGIPPEIIGRIYDPFFTTKPPTKGTGLGLSTVLGIVRSHGGFITVASTPRGTTFTINLPAAADTTGVTIASEADALPGGNGELILVVDDEEPIRRTTRMTLEKHGYRVLTVSDGAEAVAMFLENRDAVRLVLTDIMMPVMGGINLIRALRAIAPKLKIIAASGMADQASQAELSAVAVDGTLVKPYGPRELLVAVHTQLAPLDQS